jgi:hypothetical protein
LTIGSCVLYSFNRRLRGYCRCKLRGFRAALSVIVACATPLIACATITKGTTQLVAIDTPGAPGTTCTIQTKDGSQLVTTPGSVTLSKGSAALPVSCTKECYLPGSGVIASNTEAMAAGNVVFGGLIGLGVDAATGAMNKYADQVTVAMIPDQSCRRGEPPARAQPHTSSR